MNEKVQKPEATFERGYSISSAKVLKREAYEATREGQNIVAQARERARKILDDAEHERDSICHQAEVEGRIKGLAEWNDILARASQRAEELAKSWEQQMLRLAIRIAKKIIGEELKLRPDAIVDIVREALKGARPGKLLTIQVNEADAPQVRDHIDRIRDHAAIRSEIDIVTSAQAQAGGCILESELGIIDARLETQLQCLEKVLVRGVSGD